MNGRGGVVSPNNGRPLCSEVRAVRSEREVDRWQDEDEDEDEDYRGKKKQEEYEQERLRTGKELRVYLVEVKAMRRGKAIMARGGGRM
eukprot:753618-Hanusia_phi.AAC.1